MGLELFMKPVAKQDRNQPGAGASRNLPLTLCGAPDDSWGTVEIQGTGSCTFPTTATILR